MAIDLIAEQGTTLFEAFALRGLSDNETFSVPVRLEMAVQAADAYSRVLNEVAFKLLVALGHAKPGEDGEGDPIALADEVAGRMAEIENYFYTGDAEVSVE